MKTETSAYLDDHFPQFEPELREELAEIAEIRSIPAGETLMRTGQNIRSTVLVAEGRLKLYREGHDEGEIFMYYLEPGNACALSMVCGQQQETSGVMLKAIEDSTVILIPVKYMENFMQRYKGWYNFVVETYRERFEELLTLIDHIAFRAMDERLVHYLDNQREKLHTSKLHITHSEIATDLHSSREVISRLLKKLEQQGKVKLHRQYIEML